MVVWLLVVLLFPVFCESASHSVQCIPPGKSAADYSESENSVIHDDNRKIKIHANKEIEELSRGMYITELPLPHPGAQPGSTHGCEEVMPLEGIQI
ncbi:uncharacterized protein LOC117575068 isoform X2 [Drosophila albomicans]|uniref:Uncharacterized protein LOC117575068 isoform X2 n=1 Tax=Drosophila albomicans TaxID=7291 RepID=A0A9C6T746_DROAB|nr:uncharacterized protein LOC117575068 isoform X2 [Drosophila albomicans]